MLMERNNFQHVYFSPGGGGVWGGGLQEAIGLMGDGK